MNREGAAEPFWSLPEERLAADLGSSADGLAAAEARRRLADLKSGRDVGLTRDEFFADEGSNE